jgi:hypothetical protein
MSQTLSGDFPEIKDCSSSKIKFGMRYINTADSNSKDKKRLIYFSGNFLGEPHDGSGLMQSLYPDWKNKILLVKKNSNKNNTIIKGGNGDFSTPHLIGLTQYNLKYNVTIDSKSGRNTIIFHKDHPPKKLTNNIKYDQKNKQLQNPSGGYVDMSYINDESYLFPLKNNNITSLSGDTSLLAYNYLDFSYGSPLTLYFNYGIATLNNIGKQQHFVESVFLDHFLDMPPYFPKYFTDYDICLNFINNTNNIIVPPNNLLNKTDISFIVNGPLDNPTPMDNSNSKISTTFSNQIFITDNNINDPKKKYFYLDCDYIFYNNSDKIFYIYPFDESLHIEDISTIILPQKTTHNLDFRKHFKGPSASFAIFGLNLYGLDNLSNEFFYLHYDNKIIRYNNIDIYEDNEINTGRYCNNPNVNRHLKLIQQTSLARASKGISSIQNYIIIKKHYDPNTQIFNITSLNKFFTGTLTQTYQLQLNADPNLADSLLSVISRPFTLTYEIICNPNICPVLSLPSNTQLRTVGSASSSKMQFAKSINNAMTRRSKKKRFIQQ